jgi:LysM repeat protein
MAAGEKPAEKEATPPAQEKPAPEGAESYTVAKGDTLFGIARKHHIKPRDLAKWNGIKDPKQLHVGQKLTLKEPANSKEPPKKTD